jgi:hypothetical protein
VSGKRKEKEKEIGQKEKMALHVDVVHGLGGPGVEPSHEQDAGLDGHGRELQTALARLVLPERKKYKYYKR